MMSDLSSADSTAPIALTSEQLTLQLAPAIGGAIASFSHRDQTGASIELMRPMPSPAFQAGDVLAASCFPLTPFSNRLRHGHCLFRGQEIQLPLNSDGPHNEHGHGWQRPWQVERSSPDSATLLYRHAPDAWSFAYEMRQIFQLAGNKLTVVIESRNTGDKPMPYGFGLHPYFARTPRCRLQAGVQGFWTVDHEVMPVEHGPVPPNANLTAGVLVDDVELDNAFTGWSGEAVISWPEHGLRLTMQASDKLRVLVVYVPAGEDHFCVEPVSNSTDAFNLAASRDDTGMMVLAPGETVRAIVSFTVAPIDA